MARHHKSLTTITVSNSMAAATWTLAARFVEIVMGQSKNIKNDWIPLIAKIKYATRFDAYKFQLE